MVRKEKIGMSLAWILRHTKAVLYEPNGGSTYINKHGRASLLGHVEYLIEYINYLNKELGIDEHTRTTYYEEE